LIGDLVCATNNSWCEYEKDSVKKMHWCRYWSYVGHRDVLQDLYSSCSIPVHILLPSILKPLECFYLRIFTEIGAQNTAWCALCSSLALQQLAA